MDTMPEINDNILDWNNPNDFVFSCLPTYDDELLWWDYEKGIFKAFNDKKWNQLEVDPYSCFVFSPFQAIANFTNTDIDYEMIRTTLSCLERDGKFTHGVWWRMIDWVQYAVNAYNTAHNDTIKYNLVSLTVGTIIDALKWWSPMITGIHYSKTTFWDEQEWDAWINNIDSIGNMGHCISIVKINTLDDILVKYEENYDWKLKYSIIWVDFTKFRKLFFNTGCYLYR